MAIQRRNIKSKVWYVLANVCILVAHHPFQDIKHFHHPVKFFCDLFMSVPMLYPRSRHCSDFYLYRLVLTVLERCIIELLNAYTSVFFFFHSMILRYIYVVACNRSSFYCWFSVYWMNMLQTVYPLTCWLTLGYFWILAIVNKANVNILTQAYFFFVFW